MVLSLTPAIKTRDTVQIVQIGPFQTSWYMSRTAIWSRTPWCSCRNHCDPDVRRNRFAGAMGAPPHSQPHSPQPPKGPAPAAGLSRLKRSWFGWLLGKLHSAVARRLVPPFHTLATAYASPCSMTRYKKELVADPDSSR